MNVHNNVRPNMARLWSMLMRSAEIGATPGGGLNRLALSDDDATMRRQFIDWCVEAGCRIQIDGVGNIFATRAGRDPCAKPVLVGSHLDTQVHGGRFDGILGVLAGLELVHTLNEFAITTKHPITVVNWTNEEGARFEPPMMGSAIFTGHRTPDYAWARTDRHGVTLGEELDRLGFKGTDTLTPDLFDSLFELHIEQGPRLDAEKVPVGVVTGAFTVHGHVIQIRGETGHAGPTPMPSRRNALVAASLVMLAVDEIGWQFHGEEGKSTTTRLKAEPNLLGAIPKFVELNCDMRHPTAAGADAMISAFRKRLPELEERSRCSIEVTESWTYGGVELDKTCTDLVRSAAARLGYATKDLLTEAGHDALHTASVLPATIIFTPCEGGVSHNEKENVTIADIEPGMNVLLQAVLARAKLAE
ncbi:MAG: Zn-dependent hydrolase [Bosea sp.]|uniref:Zn-dependent hydrolase n=1 Tax=Bosea sp. (in: a-proteobacteria) TaxID=1871050 RepID=UPI001AD178D6|nr:Zn-dependent hydrolase [Bosea sp. (in: a-proteobacteria)]MBN9451976.1 Zn-dependent hydrolase [Bosea sp. (in: a-proteobacteria)]